MMPRSTRHKSSKHKDGTKEYSDSEKETLLKEKRSKEAIGSVRVLKESGSDDKRKEYYDSVNGEYYEELTSSSSKRRKGKSGDSVSDRWNGKDDEKGENSKKLKVSSEKSRRRDEGDGEETKKSSGKSDGKHRDSSRRESKEFDKEKDRKYKEGKSEKFYDGDDHHQSKGGSDKTVSRALYHTKSPGTENYTEKRSRRKKDDHCTGDNSDDVGDRLHDYVKDGNQKGEKRDKYEEEKEEEIKQKGDKQRDDRPVKDHPKYDEKLHRDESKQKSKFHDNDHVHEPEGEVDGYQDRERNRDYERESDRNERDRERVRDRDQDYDQDRDHGFDRERDYEHDHYHERDWDRDTSRDRDRDRSRDRDRDHERNRTRGRDKYHSRDYYYDGNRRKSDRERDNDRDVSRLDEQSGRYKDRREGRRSPDYQSYQEVNLGSRSSRAEPDGDMIRSERQLSSSVVQEEIGHVSEQIAQGGSFREAAELSGGSERGARYKVSEKTAKMEDGVLGEFPAERSSAAKASPVVERSTSATSIDRRCNNWGGARRSLEVEETGLGNNGKDCSATEEKLLVDETSEAELLFNNKANQNNSSFPPRPESRSGISSPRVGPREEHNRANTSGRYKRGGDAMIGRGQSNMWRGVPSWPSPLPNGYIPFQHIPPHGGFQTMMPQFSSASLFGVRPSMDINNQGIPYHMTDAERFPGHMRPLGWQNMMDASSASHMHGFFGDMNNSVFRAESNMYGGSEWDHNRRMHGQGLESGTDDWKTRNGDASMDVSSLPVKDDNTTQVTDNESLGGQTSHSDNNRAKSIEVGSNLTSPAKELDAGSPKVMADVTAEDPVSETIDNTERYSWHYLSKLDISAGLADPELLQSIRLLMGEEHLTMVDETAVFVNLKEGGKRLPKSNSTSLTTLSLFPSHNSSVFQIALDIYKEQRFEIKGLPIVKNHGPPQVSPSSLAKGKNSDDLNDALKGISSSETSDLKIADMSESDTSKNEPQNVSSHGGAEMEIETQDAGDSSPNSDKPHEVFKAVASDDIDCYEQETKPDDGAGVEQTMKTAPEHDGVPGGDPVTLTVASSAMDVDEQKDLSEDENMEEAEEKKEAEDGSVVVGDDISPKVTEQLVNESDESVISRIHHSPQSTH